jgi:hypothetical protein
MLSVKKLKGLLTFMTLTFITLIPAININSQANSNITIFDKNEIISNETFTSFRDFPDVNSIQRYLNEKESILKDYKENNIRASEIIFKSANGEISNMHGVSVRISPALLLTMLEKEQSLISITQYDTKKDPQNRLASAMGYGCPDSSKCDPKYKGFYNQVKYGAYQLQYNYNNANNAKFLPYNIGNTFKTMDGFDVNFKNAATTSLYRYTPHVYWGNYNVFKIMLVNQWNITKVKTSFKEVDESNKFQFKKANCDKLYSYRYTLGTQSEDVKNLQQCLRNEKYFDFPVNTGYYGNVTNSSLIKYVNDKNLCSRFLYKSYNVGQTGNEITDLQLCLINEGLFSLSKPTGYFGPITRNSLANYKKLKQY